MENQSIEVGGVVEKLSLAFNNSLSHFSYVVC